MTSKLLADKNQKILLELVTKPGNDICADCKARNPRWASHNLGIFICVNCATIHRKIGTHITKVKSLTLDSWTREQVERMKEMGNAKSNAIYNPNEVRNPPPPMLTEDERDSELEQYIRAKYEYKRYFDRNALVASKLGPSRSASSISARPHSTPADKDPAPSLSTPATPSAPSSARPVSAVPPSVSVTQSPSTSTFPSVSRSTGLASAIPSSFSMTQSRSASQPMLTPAMPSSHPAFSPALQRQQVQSQSQQQSLPVQNSNSGVWNDLISLQAPSTNSSLPLQYSSPTQAFAPSNPFSAMQSAGATGMNGFTSGTSSNTMDSIMMNGVNGTPNMGFSGVDSANPFPQMQQLQLTSTNPFSQMMPQRHQTMPPSLPSSSLGMPFGSVPNSNGITSIPFGQPQSPVPMFSPQPQVGMQMQGQGQMQQPFLTPSPQIPMSTTPQMQLSPSPFASNTGAGMGVGMSPGMGMTSPAPIGMGMQGMNSPMGNAGVMGMSSTTGMTGFGGQQQQFAGAGSGWTQPDMFTSKAQGQQWGTM